MAKTDLTSDIIYTSQVLGIPTKKIWDIFYALKSGESVTNAELIRKIGIARSVLIQVKSKLHRYLQSDSDGTKVAPNYKDYLDRVISMNYKSEEAFFDFLKDDKYKEILDVVSKFKNDLKPDRAYDQFFSDSPAVARRAKLMDFLQDLKDKNLLFLGDDDFTSIAVALTKKAASITVIDIDQRILDKIEEKAKELGLTITTKIYDVRKTLPNDMEGQFDVVFTDPPYTPEGTKLFLGRAIQCLDPGNKNARIYFCYGISEGAKERILPIYQIIADSGLLIRYSFDKFNRYFGAESIGSQSSLFVCETTPRTKSLVKGDFNGKIYTFG